MKNLLILFILLSSTSLFAQPIENNCTIDESHLGKLVAEKNGIKLFEFKSKFEFKDAKLTYDEFLPSAEVKKGKTRLSLKYKVENYQLAEQTPDAKDLCCNNSPKGQHIHLIINNAPYTAYYNTEIDTPLPVGQYNVLAFLSRSFHESIKNETAFQYFSVNIPDPGAGLSEFKFKETPELLVYSRPKGEYKGLDTKNLLFDFYMLNTKISKKGNKVKLLIDGNEFIITEWQPFIVQGLALGKHSFKISLIDKKGVEINPKDNSVTREITLLP